MDTYYQRVQTRITILTTKLIAHIYSGHCYMKGASERKRGRERRKCHDKRVKEKKIKITQLKTTERFIKGLLKLSEKKRRRPKEINKNITHIHMHRTQDKETKRRQQGANLKVETDKINLICLGRWFVD